MGMIGVMGMIEVLRMIGIIGLSGGLGIIGMIGRMGGRGLHYPIATPCTTARRVSCRVSAFEAPVRTAVAHTAANPAVGAGGHTREPVCSC
jgi:hypothetical protein